VNATLLLANAGSGMGAQIGAARVMYGMGRDAALPGWFGHIHPSTAVPSRNVIVCGAIALAGALVITYQLGAELLNFGAFLAFSGVNAACFQREYLRKPGARWFDAVMPLLALAVCLYIWASLRWQAKVAGTVWVLAGLAYRMAANERE
jgi:putrescine importer